MHFWKSLSSKLKAKQHVYLLTVIENSGSSPGRKGFKMFVSEDGFIFGSVGGGIMEFTLIEQARTLLKEEKHSIFFKKQIHKGNIHDGSGMICSGEQTVVFHPLNINHVPVVETILDSLKNNTNRTLLFSSSFFGFIDGKIEEKYKCEISSKTKWFFKEQIGFRETLYIVGGGHVGLAVSNLFKNLNFHIIVFDNRADLNTLEINKSANQKIVIDYHQIENYLIEGHDKYVAIMTNKYTDDKLVLSKIIRNSYKYIGVLGSKAKLKTMWEVMLREGYSKTELEKIYAPIGTSIKSQTPEEIAVSIAAEIISIKNQNK